MSSLTSLRGGAPVGLGITGLVVVSLRASAEGVVSVVPSCWVASAPPLPVELSSSSPQAETPRTATTAMRIRMGRSIGRGILLARARPASSVELVSIGLAKSTLDVSRNISAILTLRFLSTRPRRSTDGQDDRHRSGHDQLVHGRPRGRRAHRDRERRGRAHHPLGCRVHGWWRAPRGGARQAAGCYEPREHGLL